MALEAFLQATNQSQNPSRLSLEWNPRMARWDSLLSGSIQTTYQWGRWEGEFQWDLVHQADALPMLAFLRKYAKGGTFTIYDPTRTVPRGTGRGPVSSPVGQVTDTPVIASTSTNSLVFTASSKTIARASGGLGVFLVGQSVLIAGTTSNNKTVTIAASSNTSLTVNETLTDETNTSTGTLSFVGGQKGSILALRWPSSYASQTIFKAGDLFCCANTGEVYEVSADCTATAAIGSYCWLAAAIVQKIRTSPAHLESTPCEYVPIRMMMAENPKSEASGYLEYSFSAKFVEDLSLAS